MTPRRPAAGHLLIPALLIAALTTCGDDDISAPPDVNRPPQLIAGISNQLVPDSLSLDLSAYFTDPDGDPLTFTAESADPGIARIAVSDNTATIQAVVAGSTRMTVTATDPGGLSTSQTFTATVPNRGPQVADTLPDVETVVGEPVTVDMAGVFTDLDRDPLAITAESSDTSVATVTVSDNSLTITPFAPGTATITVTATDPGGLAAMQDFGLTVPNRPPHATDTLPGLELQVDDKATADLSAHFAEPDGQPLTFAAESSDPAVASADVAGHELTITAIAKGTATVTIIAADPGGLQATQRFPVTVPNRGPQPAGTIPDTQLQVGDETVVDARNYFSDPDGDSLTFTAVSADTLLAMAEVSGSELRVSALAKGTVAIAVTATDPGGLEAAQSFSVTIPNRAPRVADTIPGIEVGTGDTVTLDMSVRFTDPDGDSLAYSAVSSDTSVAAAGTSADEVTVTGIGMGTAAIVVTATDPEGLEASQRFSVTVPNRPPRLEVPIPHQHLLPRRLTRIDLAAHFVDPEGGPLTFAVTHSDQTVARVRLFRASLTIRGRARGVTTVTVTATDTLGLEAQTSFTAEVPNMAPRASGTLPDDNMAVDETIVVRVSDSFTDPEEDSLTFSSSSSDSTVAVATTSGDAVTVNAFSTGTATITVTATDPGGLSAALNFLVTVFETPPNRAPTPEGTMPDHGLQEGETTTVDASAYFRDRDGDVLTFRASSSNPGVASATVSGHLVTVSALFSGRATITVTATDTSGLSAAQNFAVFVRPGPVEGDGFDITLVFTDAVAPAYRSSMEAAAGTWMQILRGTEWEDVSFDSPRDCRGVEVDLGTVDDLVIIVDALAIDGDLGTVAAADTCIRRADSSPVLGYVYFDERDLGTLAGFDDLEEIMVHEITHVLGFGFRWVLLGLLDQDSDPHFTGSRAIAAFDDAGGTNYTGAKVPTEPGQGHWRDSVFGNELMDSFLYVNRREPLSAITLEALVDMGFWVDVSYADPFTLANPDRMAADAALEPPIRVRDRVDRGPQVIVDSNGRTLRVIPGRQVRQ